MACKSICGNPSYGVLSRKRMTLFVTDYRSFRLGALVPNEQRNRVETGVFTHRKADSMIHSLSSTSKVDDGTRSHKLNYYGFT
jgi:hypothetical protein